MQKAKAMKYVVLISIFLIATIALVGCGGAKQEEKGSQGQSNTGSAVKQAVIPTFKWGYVDKTGNFVIKPQFDDARPFSEGLAAAQKGGIWGFIDKTGKWIIQPLFVDTMPFKNGYAPVFDGKLWGFTDKKGNIVIGAKYKAVKAFCADKLAPVKEGNTWDFIDSEGAYKIKVATKYEDAGIFCDGLAPVKIGGLWGFIDENGNQVIKPTYIAAEPFSGGIASVKTVATYSEPSRDGVIDKNGVITYVDPFKVREQFSEGLALYEHHDHWGYIDPDGNKQIKAHYEWADKFSDSLACVRKGFFKGFIDHSGNMVIQPRFEDALGFSEGMAAVKVNPDETSQMTNTPPPAAGTNGAQTPEGQNAASSGQKTDQTKSPEAKAPGLQQPKELPIDSKDLEPESK